ncbi:MAG: glycoside hydrolase family 3 N-terminal domain-containing protein [Cypionkella sp.]|nr:glycoside hydrolase family 3 N-terminal domain-containing protein [Cypionkella sp.]
MTHSVLQGFSGAPFNLSGDQIAWVATTFAALDQRTKASLVMSSITMGPDLDFDAIAACPPGFLTRMAAGDAAHEQAQLAALNARLTVPMAYNTDLEGSTTTPKGATPSPVPLALAASGDPALTRRATEAMALEARQFGLRWSFTPCIDLNLAFRSSIVGSRSYGSDVDTVLAHTVATTQGLQAAGVAACAKHWPGEGMDQRDQHLATTVNTMSFAQWEASFGKLYRAQIEAGVLSVMAAHIALPSYMHEKAGITGPDAYLPGSLNRHLNEDLLRGHLGFNGLIVSDATAMAGITGLRDRSDLVIDVLNAGCDVIVGTYDLPADRDFILAGLADGRLSAARLDEAILRQLAFKAALGLHRAADIPSVSPEQSSAITQTLNHAPTLVKTCEGLFPVTPARYPTIYLVCRGRGFPPFSPTRPLPFEFADKLRAAGFTVVEHSWGTPVEPGEADLLLYAYAEECLLVRGTITNDWGGMTGQFQQAMKRFWNKTPTLMISFGWPYHLYEAPGVWGYINAYMAHPAMQDIVIEALQNGTFKGQSPVDALAGLPADYYAMIPPGSVVNS